MKLYSIRDTKTDMFNSPFTALTDGQATRHLSTMLQSGDTMLSKFPEDFILYSVGEFSEETGCVSAIMPEHVITVSGLLSLIDTPAR